MSRMYIVDGKPMKTWNVFIGCDFRCSYCNARKAALTRFKHIPRYQNGFLPKLVESEFTKHFKPGEFVFIAYMGDIFFATRGQILRILQRVKLFPETSFLLQTKNPSIFSYWQVNFPPNVYLSTTIETNRDYHLTMAPPPIERFRQLTGYPHNAKFLSIEPIMDFDLDTLTLWVELLQPDIIEVGADNYHNHLPEPSWGKVEGLLANLKNICPKVIEKDGLERLRERR